MNSDRLPRHPSRLASHLTDPSAQVLFHFNGKPVKARVGDTVASALYASGVRIFSRSFKYHRPRGLLCVAGKCPNCLMNVDGVPNVRACTEPVRDGMVVRHQNAWPSLNHDALSILDRLDAFLPVGFYYKSLIRPKFMWHLAQPIIRRIAGLGEIDVHSGSGGEYEHYNRQTDVAVVGGGPAGICAAIEAGKAGARVTLIDDQPSLGGHLRADMSTRRGLSEHPDDSGFEVSGGLIDEAEGLPNVEVLSGATAFGLYEGNLLGVSQGRRTIKLRSKRVVIASGSNEVPLVFRGNDLPGVFLSTGVRRLMHLYGVKPGRRAVVATGSDQGYDVASELVQAGVEVVAVTDARETVPQGLDAVESLRSHNVPILPSHTVKEARGKKHVRGVVVASLNKDNRDSEGKERRFRCDLLCIAGGTDPSVSLLYQAGCQLDYDETLGETIPSRLPPAIYAAGDVTGIHDLRAVILQGRIAGMEAAFSLLDSTEEAISRERVEGYRRELSEREARYREQLRVSQVLVSPGPGKKKFVCICEDVTEKDLHDAIAEGFDEMQTLKRYSTLSMGPCQGKMCLKAAIGICAAHTGLSINETGTTTSRPPVHPVPLGALAGPPHMPIKLTPLDQKHRELGARMMDLGPWKRPNTYGSPRKECAAVRQGVGIIDVSTLGKLDVQGKDAPALLDKVYTHVFSTLPVGRIRYGLLCSDNGTIMDDGTITRLAEDHYFITTTTGNIDLMEEWLKLWAAGTGWCVHVTNVTAGYAAINVAGPRARDTLSKLTDIDLSPSAFRYMRSATGEVAGVPAMLLRIGFVGETGWELHFPAEYGEYVWDMLMEAGKEFDIAPFGVEAQRILRLEKKHIIIGQDTDAVSNPLEGDLSWVVRFEKDDFIGKHALQAVQERGLRDKLVGFVMEDSAVPEDGVPVVAGGKPVGRVTSSRLSTSLGRGIGFIWVPVELSEDGTEVHIQVNGRPMPARVLTAPFYDPEGKRLRE